VLGSHFDRLAHVLEQWPHDVLHEICGYLHMFDRAAAVAIQCAYRARIRDRAVRVIQNALVFRDLPGLLSRAPSADLIVPHNPWLHMRIWSNVECARMLFMTEVD